MICGALGPGLVASRTPCHLAAGPGRGKAGVANRRRGIWDAEEAADAAAAFAGDFTLGKDDIARRALSVVGECCHRTILGAGWPTLPFQEASAV
jgi:hypothetical protein